MGKGKKNQIRQFLNEALGATAAAVSAVSEDYEPVLSVCAVIFERFEAQAQVQEKLGEIRDLVVELARRIVDNEKDKSFPKHVFNEIEDVLNEVRELVEKVAGRKRFSSWWNSRKDLESFNELLTEVHTIIRRTGFELNVSLGVKIETQHSDLREKLESEMDRQGDEMQALQLLMGEEFKMARGSAFPDISDADLDEELRTMQMMQDQIEHRLLTLTNGFKRVAKEQKILRDRQSKLQEKTSELAENAVTMTLAHTKICMANQSAKNTFRDLKDNSERFVQKLLDIERLLWILDGTELIKNDKLEPKWLKEKTQEYNPMKIQEYNPMKILPKNRLEALENEDQEEYTQEIFADRILQRVIEGLKDSKTRDEKAYADLESLVNLQNTTTEKQSDLNKKVKQFIDRAEKLKKKQNEAFEFIDGLAHYLRCEIFRTRHSKDENVSIEQFLEQADNSELPDKKLLLSMIL
eukprot:g649.t1